MKTKELIEYLSGFHPESQVIIKAIDTSIRVEYSIEKCFFIDDEDQENPALIMDVGESSPLGSVAEVIE